MTRAVRSHVAALVAYVVLTLVFVWPLPLRLGHALTGRVTGDTGVYVWNLWVFHREFSATNPLPLSTSTIFSLDGPVDLSLHNYTVFANLVGLPLVPVLGVVEAFNVVFLGLTVLGAYAMFLLARRLSGHAGAAWLAGALLMFSPTLVARSTGHFSLVNVAPLPLFTLAALLAAETGRIRWAIASGGALAAAAYADPYYGVYCLLIAAAIVIGRTIVVTAPRRVSRRWPRRLVWGFGLLAAASLALAAWIAATGGNVVALGPLSIGLRTPYTPALVASLSALAAWLLGRRLIVAVTGPASSLRSVRLVAAATATSIVLLLPIIIALVRQVAEGHYVAAPVFWRSSMPGIDLLATLLPNPNHPLVADVWRPWLRGLPGGYIANVASPSFVALAVILTAARRGWRLPRFWAAFSLFFFTLALGPFVRLAGVTTGFPTPWTLLRYVPIVGAARAPARFMVLALMGFAVLFAIALAARLRAQPARRRALLALVGVALLVELLPAPRRLYSAGAPAVYDRIAADPRPVRVLVLPTGVRDGLSSMGDFNASAQFYQTVHGKPLVGGYLSRVSAKRKAAVRADTVWSALVDASGGRVGNGDRAARLASIGRAFSKRVNLGYVVIDRERARPGLEDLAVRVLDLEYLDEDRGHVLYRPRGSRP